jgi:hypothetical protein
VFILPLNPKFTHPVPSIFDMELVIRDIFNSLRASEMGEIGQYRRKKASREVSLIMGAYFQQIVLV